MIGLNKIKLTTKALIGSAMLCTTAAAKGKVVKVATRISGGTELPIDTFFNSKTSELTKLLPWTFRPTRYGRVTEFENKELHIISKAILRPNARPPKYSPPIPREHYQQMSQNWILGENENILPELGVDISVNKGGVKSVPVLSPTNGIIVFQGISSALKSKFCETRLLDSYGKIHTFKFITDTPLVQKLGSALNQNDTIGTIVNNPGTHKFNLFYKSENL